MKIVDGEKKLRERRRCDIITNEEIYTKGSESLRDHVNNGRGKSYESESYESDRLQFYSINEKLQENQLGR